MNDKTSTLERTKPSYSGRELREMFCVATRWLEKNATVINALNVFPVPDGDTGTNMLLTMRSTMSEATRPMDTNASDIAQAMARGALMGARGNSGVILSQIFKGLALGFEGKKSFGPKEMAIALDQASIAAYKSMSKPREGTMLTVIKDAAEKARSCVECSDTDLIDLMQSVVVETKNSVARTPELLDVLKEAGVVDAGGQGVHVILDGALHYLQGEVDEIELLEKEIPAAKQPAFVAAKLKPKKEEVYGYCTEMLIKGDELNQDQIRRWVESQGESVIVVGDSETAKIHVHTVHPGSVIEFAVSLGSVHDLKIQNMDDQHEEFIEMRRAPMPEADIAVIAVAAGAGLEEVFYSLGTTTIIPGGQTMNPSCSDILEAIDMVPSDKVIVLPNNKNIVPTAKQAATVTKKKVKVLPTKSVPQGISAMVAFNCEMGMDANIEEMNIAREGVRSIEVTRAVRDAKIGAVKMNKGDYVGLIDGSIKVAGTDLDEVINGALRFCNVDNTDIATLYYGDEVEQEDAEKLVKMLKGRYPDLEVELINGGQPHYSYLISLE